VDYRFGCYNATQRIIWIGTYRCAATNSAKAGGVL
jgi:hypothetical protein